MENKKKQFVKTTIEDFLNENENTINPASKLKELIKSGGFLDNYIKNLYVKGDERGSIKYNNERITEKYISIYYKYDELKNSFTFTVAFNSDISDDIYDIGVWKKYMGDNYTKPQYAHQDPSIVCTIDANNSSKIYRFLEDIVKSFILKYPIKN